MKKFVLYFIMSVQLFILPIKNKLNHPWIKYVQYALLVTSILVWINVIKNEQKKSIRIYLTLVGIIYIVAISYLLYAQVHNT